MKRAAILPLACTLLLACQSTADSHNNNTSVNDKSKPGFKIKPQPVIQPERQRSALVQVMPKYPRDALRKGVTGWVLLSYSINKRGGTENIHVVDSSPEGYFENSAVSALARWKFKPQLEDQKRVKETELQELIVYTIQ